MKLCLCIVAKSPELLIFSEASNHFRMGGNTETGLGTYLDANENTKDSLYVEFLVQQKNINAMLSNYVMLYNNKAIRLRRMALFELKNKYLSYQFQFIDDIFCSAHHINTP